MSSRVREWGEELLHFGLANIKASYFGIFLLLLLLLTHFVEVPLLSRYDFIFLSAVVYQVVALVSGHEKLREFAVIFVFHIVATGMELFKTNPAIGSWAYPEVGAAVFAVATVPLFTGFLYSAVGSYISSAFKYLNLRYENFPAYHHIWIISVLIYINFFTHHFVYDIRYLLFLYIGVVFAKTVIRFKTYKKEWHLPFILSGFLMALFVWIAENVGSYSRVWLYPTQVDGWHLVSLHKLESWFLLLILSFALVSIVYRHRIATVSTT